MEHSSLDEQAVVHDAVRSLLEAEKPGDVEAFELSFLAMYAAVVEAAPPATTPDEPFDIGFAADQLADASFVALAVLFAKGLLRVVADPLLEDRLLPRLDEMAERFAKTTGHPKLVGLVREHLERAIRRHLGLPREDRK